MGVSEAFNGTQKQSAGTKAPGSRRVERLLPISSIDIDRFPFARVLDFVAAFRNGVECKPIKVQWSPGTSRWKIKDGRHRFMAMKLLGRTHIPVRHAARERPRPTYLTDEMAEASARMLMEPFA